MRSYPRSAPARCASLPRTVRNSVLPLRAVFRRAVARSEVVQNLTLGREQWKEAETRLSLPAVRGRRDRVARPEERGPSSPPYRWATGRSGPPPSHAGLRRGELQALRWEDVDL